MPVLCKLARQHPKLTLDVAFADRAVDLLEENIDLVVRLGDSGNSAFLSARYLGHQRTVTCGSPAYFAEHGCPASLDDLASHDCITFKQGGYAFPWKLVDSEGRSVEVKIKGRHTISDGDALRDAVLDGLGIGQFPTWLVADALRSGTLQAVLAPQGVEGSPIHALWPATRDLAPRIRAAVDELLLAFIPVAPWDNDLTELTAGSPTSTAHTAVLRHVPAERYGKR